MSDKKYKTVVIDFPWPVEPISKSAGDLMGGTPLQEGLPYKTMTLKQIREFPIEQFADKDCALWLWTTNGFIWDARDLIVQWGFKIGRLITWDKKRSINWLGFALRSEFVIFAYRGKYPIKVLKGKTIPTVLSVLRTGHSEKPSAFYSAILPFTPEPRIDIFARKRHYGFDAWGDQVQEAPMTIENYS